MLDQRANDLTNTQFGKLTALRPTAERDREYIIWECVCECGARTYVSSCNLVRRRTKSCGCTKTERYAGAGREYSIWTDMKTRCSNPKNSRFHRYGGRGIRVCERWGTFENFFSDMGPCPVGMSIDRINNDGPYEPGNCRWSSPKQQARNFSRNRMLTFAGETLCLADWGLRTGISSDVIYNRLKWKWPIDKTLTTPVRKLTRHR